MTTGLAAFGLAFAAAVVCTVLARVLALRLGIVDRPDRFRKVHQRSIPRLGGVAIFVAFTVPIAILYFLHPNRVSDVLHERPWLLMGLILGGAMAMGIGVVDDIWGLPARWKLLLQTAPAVVALASGFTIRAISTPFGEPLTLGLLSVPVTLFWFLGCMNAVNLLDGLDGLATGVCLFASLTLLLVSLFFGNVLSLLLMCCLSGASLGFLVFNFHPASIFLGDSGSMLLGFLIAALSLLGTRKAETTIALLIPVVALGLPIFDTALAILRRWARRLPLAAADRQHIHHVLLATGLSHRSAVLILYMACILLGGAALLITAGRSEVTILVLGSLGIVAFVCVRVFGGLRFGQLWGRFSEELERRHRSAEAKISVEKAASWIRWAPNADALWDAFSMGIESLGLDHATFHVFGKSDSEMRVLTWRHHDFQPEDVTAEERDGWTARFRVRNNGHVLGRVEVCKVVEGHSPGSAGDSLLPPDTRPDSQWHDNGRHAACRGSRLLADAPELVGRLLSEMGARLEEFRSQNDE